MLARQRSAPDKRKESSEEAKLREAVLSEVLDVKPSESWQDIAGLGGAKQVRQPCHSYAHLCNLYTCHLYTKGGSLQVYRCSGNHSTLPCLGIPCCLLIR